MGANARIFWLLLWAALAIVSLHPVSGVEQGIDFAFAPARILSELASPISRLRARHVAAHEKELRAREADELARRIELIRDQWRFAQPAREDLRAGRTFLGAQVIGRPKENLDRIAVALEEPLGVLPGMPVVCGDVYVGRVVELDPLVPERALIDLVTGRSFAVGVQVDSAGELTDAVAGGLVGSRNDRARTYRLALRHPERAVSAGTVRISESWSALEPYGYLADGYELGELTLSGSGERGIEPLIDYQTGLFQLVVVAPAEVEKPSSRDPLELFSDSLWQEVRATAFGDPIAGRFGFKIAAGKWNGVEIGTAMAFGPALVGRVHRVGVLSSDVSLLLDPGLSIPAVARLESRDRPHVLGRLVSLGPSDEPGRIRFAWDALVPVDSDHAETALVFTGAGERGVPEGLLIGSAELPCGPGPHEIEIAPAADGRDLRTFWLRTSSEGRP